MSLRSNRTMKLAAIDPGSEGAIVINKDGGLFAERFKFVDGELDIMHLYSHLVNTDHLFYETPNKGYGQKINANTIYKGGFYTGVIHAICKIENIQLHEYSSSVWMAEFFGRGAKRKNNGKKPSIKYCANKYPIDLIMPGRCTTIHNGITDALCLLEFGMKKLEQNNGN